MRKDSLNSVDLELGLWVCSVLEAKAFILQYIKEIMQHSVYVAVSSYLINGVPSRRAWLRGETCR